MINFDDYLSENKTEHDYNIWPYIPDNSHKILLIEGSASGKTNLLLNLIEDQQQKVRFNSDQIVY